MISTRICSVSHRDYFFLSPILEICVGVLFEEGSTPNFWQRNLWDIYGKIRMSVFIFCAAIASLCLLKKILTWRLCTLDSDIRTCEYFAPQPLISGQNPPAKSSRTNAPEPLATRQKAT